MDKEKFSDYMEKRYHEQIKWYSKKSANNKKRFQSLLSIVTVFSILTPILLVTRDTTLQYVAMAFSAIVAIAATFSRSFNFQENWINYRTISETLKKEIHYYDAKLSEYQGAEDPEALFVSRVENLISRENTTWVTCQKSTKEASPANN